MKISGCATPEGTAAFHNNAALPTWAIHKVLGLSLTALGVGTYIGRHDSETDTIQKNALTRLLRLGCNVIDCAPNYRAGRSEMCVGETLTQLIEGGEICRESVFVTTKVGLIPENSTLSGNYRIGPEQSCYDPCYLKESLSESLHRLNLETVDCVFLHNLELLRLTDSEHFDSNFSIVAECMEQIVKCGMANSWGISSWNGFRVPEYNPEYLSLTKLLSNNLPHMHYLQVPLGLWGIEVITGKWQEGKSLLDDPHNLAIFANSPLLQGEIVKVFKNNPEYIEKSICFVRDTQNISVTLLGIKQNKHVSAWQKIQHMHYDNMDEILEHLSEIL